MSRPSYGDVMRALRERAQPAADGGEATRRRIERTLASQARRSPRMRKLFFVIAASLAVSTALAYFVASWRYPAHRTRTSGPGSQSPSVMESEAAAPPSSPAKAPAQLDRASQTQAPAAVADGAIAKREAGAASGSRDAGAASGAGALSPTERKHAQHTRPMRAAARVEPAPRAATAHSEAELRALFARAHRLHFRGAPSAALAAWNAFLEASPPGPRRLLAQYNRAVVLARLGRGAEAKLVLSAFARGEHGDFRRAEAARLLEELDR